MLVPPYRSGGRRLRGTLHERADIGGSRITAISSLRRWMMDGPGMLPKQDDQKETHAVYYSRVAFISQYRFCVPPRADAELFMTGFSPGPSSAVASACPMAFFLFASDGEGCSHAIDRVHSNDCLDYAVAERGSGLFSRTFFITRASITSSTVADQKGGAKLCSLW